MVVGQHSQVKDLTLPVSPVASAIMSSDPRSLRRPPPDFRRARVTDVVDRSPYLVTLRLEGSELAAMEAPEPAASIRLLLPRGGAGTELELASWNGNEFLYADGTRPPIRTLTPLRFEVESSSVEIDVVLHAGGALSDWARARPAGDEVAVSGPGRGYAFSPAAERFLLVGDESAIPAIGQLLESLPASSRVEVIIEVAHPDARVELPAHPGATITWGDLPAGTPPGSAMVEQASAFADRASLDGLQVWVAGEAAAVQQLRTLFQRERGLPRNQTVIRGYWKHGRAGAGS